MCARDERRNDGVNVRREEGCIVQLAGMYPSKGNGRNNVVTYETC